MDHVFPFDYYPIRNFIFLEGDKHKKELFQTRTEEKL